MTAAPALLYAPSVVGADAVDRKDANRLLDEWGTHPLGPCHRPFEVSSHVLSVRGEPVALTMTASIVLPTVEAHARGEVIELARIARAPHAAWALRPMLRLWREALAFDWHSWPFVAAYSYAVPGTEGDIYRFDGWERIGRRKKASAGSSSTWSNTSATDGIADGVKTLWRWTYLSRAEVERAPVPIGPESTTPHDHARAEA